MPQTFLKKITLLNEISLNSVSAGSQKEIFSNFLENGIKILDSDFGFIWYRARNSDKYKLYRSKNLHYTPNYPRKKGGANSRVEQYKLPLLVKNVSKTKYLSVDTKANTKSVAVIPIYFEKETYGNIVFGYKNTHTFSKEEYSLSVALGNVMAQTMAINRLQRKIKHAAYHDILTGLPNRFLFTQRLSALLKGSKKRKKLFALIFMDLDEFKSINDTFGHLIGDSLLRQIGQLLKRSVKRSDTVSRLGGDEFVILMANITSPEDTKLVINRIKKALQKPFKLQKQKIFLSVSMGISIFPKDGTSAEILLKKADNALYRAKQHDGNSIEHYQK